MSQIVVDNETLAKLKNVTDRVEIIDDAGHVWGLFSPLPYGQEPPIDKAELSRREIQRGGRPLSEILADWKRGA